MLLLLQATMFLLLVLEKPAISDSSKYEDSVFKTFKDIPKEIILSLDSGNGFVVGGASVKFGHFR